MSSNEILKPNLKICFIEAQKHPKSKTLKLKYLLTWKQNWIVQPLFIKSYFLYDSSYNPNVFSLNSAPIPGNNGIEWRHGMKDEN